MSRIRAYLLRFPLEQSATENRVRIRKRGGGRREKRRREQQRLRWDDWMHAWEYEGGGGGGKGRRWNIGSGTNCPEKWSISSEHKSEKVSRSLFLGIDGPFARRFQVQKRKSFCGEYKRRSSSFASPPPLYTQMGSQWTPNNQSLPPTTFYFLFGRSSGAAGA